jgi:hypothetical protein
LAGRGAGWACAAMAANKASAIGQRRYGSEREWTMMSSHRCLNAPVQPLVRRAGGQDGSGSPRVSARGETAR